MPRQYSREELIQKTREVVAILDDWQVGPADQVTLLGLGPDTPSRMMLRYRMGTPLPDNEETALRVSYLIAINTALQTTFPHSAQSSNLWVTTPHINFGNRTPLEVMIAGGKEGIEKILRSLDNTGGW